MKALLAMAILSIGLLARAQSLSAPERPPIPMTDADLESRRRELLDQKPAAPQAQIRIPGAHISSGDSKIDALVREAAEKYRLDPCIIHLVMYAESRYNPSAVSPKGASGLMQLMPATALRLGVRNIFDPRQNVLGGASYLRWLLDRFSGNLPLALAAYNAGEGAVEFYGYRIPPYGETQNYVRTIYSQYLRIHGTSSPLMPAADNSKQLQDKTPIPTYNQILRFPPPSQGQKP